jgi:hypothetical protein
VVDNPQARVSALQIIEDGGGPVATAIIDDNDFVIVGEEWQQCESLADDDGDRALIVESGKEHTDTFTRLIDFLIGLHHVICPMQTKFKARREKQLLCRSPSWSRSE